MNASSPAQTITPERQAAAAQVASVFNSLHAYVSTLQFKNEEGEPLTTQPLEYVRKSIEEASFWAVKHVLSFGVPPVAAAPAPAEPAAPTPPPPSDTAANDTADTEVDADSAEDMPAPDDGLSKFDPPAPPSLDDIENKSAGEDTPPPPSTAD